MVGLMTVVYSSAKRVNIKPRLASQTLKIDKKK